MIETLIGILVTLIFIGLFVLFGRIVLRLLPIIVIALIILLIYRNVTTGSL